MTDIALTKHLASTHTSINSGEILALYIHKLLVIDNSTAMLNEQKSPDFREAAMHILGR